MGQLIHKKGDFTTSSALILAHGCNCRGGFGSGVAGQIAKLYPLARQSYISKHKNEGWKLGEVQFVELHPGRIIANCATQDTYGKLGVHVNYPAVGKCFETLLDYAESLEADVAIPHIGAGLAGGDWSKIEGIIVNCLMNRKVIVHCYQYDQGN